MNKRGMQVILAKQGATIKSLGEYCTQVSESLKVYDGELDKYEALKSIVCDLLSLVKDSEGLAGFLPAGEITPWTSIAQVDVLREMVKDEFVLSYYDVQTSALDEQSDDDKLIAQLQLMRVCGNCAYGEADRSGEHCRDCNTHFGKDKPNWKLRGTLGES